MKSVDILGLGQRRNSYFVTVTTHLLGGVRVVSPGLAAELTVNYPEVRRFGPGNKDLCVRIHTDNHNDVDAVKAGILGLKELPKGVKVNFEWIKTYPTPSVTI